MKTRYQKITLALVIAALYASPSYSQTHTSFGGFRDNAAQNTAGTGGNASNSYFGHQAGLANNGTGNTFIGNQSGFSNTTATDNTANGYQALRNNTTARRNTAIGTHALYTQSFSNGGVVWDTNNVAVGFETLYANNPSIFSNGRYNTALGTQALRNNTTGSNNTAYGYQSGHDNQTGSGNVFLGYQAGYSETGSDRLYIDNSNTATPLIWGDFSANQLQFNGDVVITGIPTAPTAAAGTNTVQLATTAFVTAADNLKANLASPAFTGLPSLPTGTTAVTQAAGNSSTALATTAFVTTAGNLKANLASPIFTGTPSLPTGTTAVTQAAGNSSTALATTAFVTAANATAHTFSSYPDSAGDGGGNGNSYFGQEAGLVNTAANNTFMGYQSGFSNTIATDNTAYGHQALRNNTTARRNTAMGTNALFTQSYANGGVAWDIGNVAIGFEALYSNQPTANTNGNYNTAVGNQALRSNTTGYQNSAHGYRALYSNTTGNNNTANGFSALINNTTGSSNTANGINALYSNTTGIQNTAHGLSALYSNSTGVQNTAHGSYALFNNTIGGNNTAHGWQTLYYNTTGNNNTALGYAAGPANGNGAFSNSTAIGYNTVMTASNQVRIGNASVTSIGGIVAWSVVSDGRFKKNLQEDVPGLAFIQQLRPVSYEMNRPKLNKFFRGEAGDDKRNSLLLSVENKALDLATVGSASSSAASSAISPTESPALPAPTDEAETKTIPTATPSRHTGFIAQEVEQIVKDNGYTFSGVEAPQNEHDHYSLRYAEFVVPLVKAVQEQQAQIEALQQGKSLATSDSAVSTTFTAQHNTVQGTEALTANTTGEDNTATGAGGLFSNTTGNDNTATGRDALFDNTTGSYNTASGRLALFDNVTGNYNTALGYDAGTQAGDLNNTTALGHGATTTASNQIRIGNAEVTSIGGYVGWSTLSDTRFKQDIQEDVAGLAFIEQLRPISYVTDTPKLKAFLRDEPVNTEDKSEATPTRSIGFAAQEVEQLIKDKSYVFTGVEKPQNEHDHYNLRYAEFVVPLVKGMQEQQAMITVLQQQNETLQQFVQSQQQQNEAMQQELALLKSLVQGGR